MAPIPCFKMKAISARNAARPVSKAEGQILYHSFLEQLRTYLPFKGIRRWTCFGKAKRLFSLYQAIAISASCLVWNTAIQISPDFKVLKNVSTMALNQAPPRQFSVAINSFGKCGFYIALMRKTGESTIRRQVSRSGNRSMAAR